MADRVSKAVRSRMMAGIRGKNTKPELAVRKALTAAGVRYRLHRKDLPGVPDLVMAGRRAAVFVHGCFWHCHKGCRHAKVPSSNTEFWKAKLERNVERDKAVVTELLAAGWRVLTVWECTTRGSSETNLKDLLVRWLEGTDQGSSELPHLKGCEDGNGQ
ncbi:very short patch repair endonuclease [Nitrospirillum sp. BR 11828]|uniref:very short patch repair endonuclease n=1 Tax=Nitrospirillum sp. BR 11828 TaxID=3104325 RepID=UPI002ACA2501|nr:very short patch repair endonuclease [Nitrospirillum sp. BR 11828]MDZ5649442.1 very short patch repair endonuclease [Nitrospirillum sp. BR 11828]